MKRAIPLLVVLLSGLGMLQLGIVQTLLVLVLLIAVWIGVLENLSGPTHEGIGRVVMVWAIYAVLLLLAVIVNSRDLKVDLLLYLPGQAVFLYFITSRTIEERYIARLIVWAAVFNAVLALAQYLVTPQFDAVFAGLLGESSFSNYHFVIGRLTGIWKDSVRLGVFLAAALPFGLWLQQARRTRTSVVQTLLVGIVIFLTYTRVAILSAVLTVVLTAGRSARTAIKRLIPVAVVVVILAIVVQATPLGQGLERIIAPGSFAKEYSTTSIGYNRGQVLQALLPVLFKRPIFGVGIQYREYLSQGFTSAHNSLLQSALMFGVPATLALVVLMYVVVAALVGQLRRGQLGIAVAALLGATAIIISGSSHGVVFDFPLNLLFWMLAGIGIRQAQETIVAQKHAADLAAIANERSG